MKVYIIDHKDGVNYAGQYLAICLDKGLPQPICEEVNRVLVRTEEYWEWAKRNFFRKSFEVGSWDLQPDYQEKKMECLKNIIKYIHANWGHFRELEIWQDGFKIK